MMKKIDKTVIDELIRIDSIREIAKNEFAWLLKDVKFEKGNSKLQIHYHVFEILNPNQFMNTGKDEKFAVMKEYIKQPNMSFVIIDYCKDEMRLKEIVSK